jgi:LysM domain
VDQGDGRAGGLEAAEAARAEAEAAAEVASGGAVLDMEAEAAASPVCRFLRLDRDGALQASSGMVDVDHLCAALATPVPVSVAQQTLVCLVATHVDCPRYLRGSNVLPIVEPAARRSIPRPTLVAAAVLVGSLAGSLAYTAANGGLSIPIPTATPPASAAIAASATPSGATPVPSAGLPSPSPASTPAPSLASATPASPAASAPAASAPAASAPAASAPAASAPAASGATADRLALLEPCPGRPDCYVYTVRPGDNLTSIGLFFGVPFDTILRLNPWIGDPTTIHKGDRIVLTTPTR